MTKEAQDRIAEEKRRAAENIARVEREEAIKDALPVRPDFAYAHADSTHITYRGGHPSYSGKGLTLGEVLPLLDALPPLERTHRRDGCLSINPEGWHDRYKDAPEEYRSAVNITTEGGKGFGPSVSVEWHTEYQGKRIKASAEVGAFLKGIRVYYEGRTYDRNGEVLNPGRLVAAPIDGARLVKWGSGSPDSYRVGWYWPTLAAFREWVAAQETAKV